MLSELMAENERFREILDRLSNMAIEDYYNPYRMFEWPSSLPESMWWMTPELMTTRDAPAAEELSEEQLQRISRYESINFYSLNVHGIRELIVEVTRRIHTTGFEIPSEFFHHFIGEENEHMWFFAEFCLRYGGKIYKQPNVADENVRWPEATTFLVFARILLFEELVDYFNMKMGNDETLHETIRQINRIHHQDESRHIAFGRELLGLLYQDLERTLPDEQLREIESYVKRYIRYSFESLYNPRVYRDAGIPGAVEFRNNLLSSPRSAEFEQSIFRKPLRHLTKIGVISDTNLDIDEPAMAGS